MTREQHAATRDLEATEERWLLSYHWRKTPLGRFTHDRDPGHYTLRDAVSINRSNLLKFGSSRTG